MHKSPYPIKKFSTNMKKLGILILLISFNFSYSQINRFVYQVSMKLDSTDKKNIKTEEVYLDISPEKTMFYSENRIKRDSVLKANFQNGEMRSFNRDQMEALRSNISYTIEKDKKSQKLTFKDRIGRDMYSYEEERPINWVMSSETSKIGDYKVQKATTDFAGRKWIAWFTTNLPYQDGPYKFGGLPGLIIKVEDSAGDYSFDLMKNYKITDFADVITRGNTIKVKRKDFENQQSKFSKDPISYISQSMGNNGGGRSFAGAPAAPMRASGVRNDNPDMRKRMEERIKQEIKSNNNPIER